MNPDGISYLDVGDAFVHHNWPVAINGWWSPLYAWTLGLVVYALRPAPQLEFAVVHAVNFVIFAFTLFAFRFLLRSLLTLTGAKHNHQFASRSGALLPRWCVELIGYAIFLWISLEVITLYDVSPDLAVCGAFFLATGTFLTLRRTSAVRHSLLLGFSLGLGYWIKTILLPVGILSLCVAFFWSADKVWRKRLIEATIVFAVLAAPFIISLSLLKHRFTFGDSGRVNYAWAMSNAPRRNWQGEGSDVGRPLHPTRLVIGSPPVYEFSEPVIGTYPPWTDPSYWNEGIRTHFRFGQQMRILTATVPSEARLLLRAQPALFAGVLFLAMLSGAAFWTRMRQLWPFLLISVAGMGAYVPIIENDRYVGGFVLVLFVVLLACVQVPALDQRSAKYISLAMFAAMALSTVDLTVRIATNHPSIPGNMPLNTADQVVVAQRLWASGIHPGDSVAVIGDGTGAYWARLGKLHIVAEVMSMGHGTERFWNSPERIRGSVYKAFADAHARAAVGTCPSETRDNWQHISGTPVCFRMLED